MRDNAEDFIRQLDIRTVTQVPSRSRFFTRTFPNERFKQLRDGSCRVLVEDDVHESPIDGDLVRIEPEQVLVGDETLTPILCVVTHTIAASKTRHAILTIRRLQLSPVK